MSATADEMHSDDVTPGLAGAAGPGQPGLAGLAEEPRDRPVPVVVRRNAGLAALIGGGASAIAIAYLWRASQSGLVLDWVLCAGMAMVAAFYLTSLVDSRTPLLVADELGVRIRLGAEWRGLPWDAIGRVVVQPRRGPLRDGRLAFTPGSLGRALDGLDARGKRHARMNQKMYGAALAVPVGITTRVSTRGERSVADELAELAQGRTEVVEAMAPVAEPTAAPATRADTAAPAPGAIVAEATEPATTAPAAAGPAADPATAADIGPTTGSPPASGGPTANDEAATSSAQPRRSLLGGIGTIVSRVAKGRSQDVDAPSAQTERPPAGEPHPVAAGPDPADRRPALTLPLRETRRALRAEVTRELPATLGNAALRHSPDDSDVPPALPEGRELRRPGSVDLVFEPVDPGRVRPISQLGEPVEPLVIDDFVTEPAYDPVIGPELAAARTRLGLSVDELADRTRIRPHVIESIEVDDFMPCGGDFYARGHLRTLARVLGQDAAPLLAAFEERYATAPVNARRVFEAELATGMTGSMRSTVGGPNWGLLVGVVLALVLVWGVVRLFGSEPAELMQTPPPVLSGAAPAPDAYPGGGPVEPARKPLPITLVAAHAGSHVVVRDGSGAVVFTGDLVLGEKKALNVEPPVRVRAGNAGAIEVQVRGKDRGVLGELDQPGRRTFPAPSR